LYAIARPRIAKKSMLIIYGVDNEEGQFLIHNGNNVLSKAKTV